MAFVPEYMTGFEIGTVEIVPASQRSGSYVSVQDSLKHTGNYALRLDASSAQINFPVAGLPVDLYIGLWVQMHLSPNFYIGIRSQNDNNYGIHFDGTRFDGYKRQQGFPHTEVVQGNISIDQDIWYHVSLYVKEDASVGQVTWKVNGVDDNTFTGNLQIAVGETVEFLEFEVLLGDSGSYAIVDDLVYGHGGFPPDLRADVLIPESDTITDEWTKSAGSDAYALIDEVPPSDADYIESSTNDQVTRVNMADWDATNKDPKYVALWARAVKDEAAAHQINLISSDGDDTEETAAMDIQTDYEYINHIFDNSPDGSEWSNASIDALITGVRSIIV